MPLLPTGNLPWWMFPIVLGLALIFWVIDKIKWLLGIKDEDEYL